MRDRDGRSTRSPSTWTPPSGVAVHPDHGSDAGDAAAAGRPGRHTRPSRCRAACSCSTRRWSPARCAGSGLAGDLRRALDDGRAGGLLPAQGRRCADRRLVGVECLARWEHPAHGTVAAGGLRGGGRAHRPARPAHRGGAREGLRRGREWADAGRPLAVAVNLSAAYADRPALPGPGRTSCSTEYGVPPRAADPGDHRGGRARRHRPADAHPAPAARPRGPAVGRRLRHRLLVAGLPAPAAGARGEDRPVASCRAWRPTRATWRSSTRVVDLSRQFGLAVVAEGVESELTLEPARGHRLRDRPGLPVQPAAAVRAAGGLARRPDRAGAGAGRRGPAAAGGAAEHRADDTSGIRFHRPSRAVYSYPCAPRGRSREAPLAQSAERLHGKEKVYGSIP